MNPFGALALWLAFCFLFFGGWYALFGAPTGGLRYVALAFAIGLWRLGVYLYKQKGREN